jgi:hypothetical protein
MQRNQPGLLETLLDRATLDTTLGIEGLEQGYDSPSIC